MERLRGPNAINLLAGLWLLVSPAVLGFGQVYALAPNNVFWGLVMALLAASRLWWHQGAWAAWTDFVLAAWIIASPGILGSQNAAFTLNNWLVGALILAMSVWSAIAQPRMISGQTFVAAEPSERELRDREATDAEARQGEANDERPRA